MAIRDIIRLSLTAWAPNPKTHADNRVSLSEDYGLVPNHNLHDYLYLYLYLIAYDSFWLNDLALSK